MDHHVAFAGDLLVMCHTHEREYFDPANGRVASARALTTCLASIIASVKAPEMLMALIIRDLSEAVLRGEHVEMSPPAPRRRRRKNVVDLAAARRRRRPIRVPDPEPA